MKYKVSIVIPVYNAEKYLRKCLDSIFNQDYKNIEVICINDGSKDSSLDILNEYKNEYEEIMVIKSIENAGQANARNIGIKESTGDYIMFVDSDDYIDNSMIISMVDRIHDNADMIVCNIDRIFEGEFGGFYKNFSFDNPLYYEKITNINDNPEIICFLTAAPYAKLINRDFLLKNNISFVKGYIYEDLVFTQMILSCNPQIKFIKDKYYKYFVRNNTTMTSKKSRVTDMFTGYQTIYNYYKDKGIYNQFKDELDYLCLYHVLIGTSFRMWQSKQFGLFESIVRCRRFVRKYNCKKSNHYLKEKGFIVRLFVVLFG